MFISLSTLFSSIVALIIPFVMKDLDKQKQNEQEINLMKLVIKRIEHYFINQQASYKPEGTIYLSSRRMPFFVELSKSKPEILYKIGIEVDRISKREVNGIARESEKNIVKLFIVDKYLLWLDNIELKINTRNVHGYVNDEEFSLDLFDKIKSEMIKYAKDNFKIDLSDSIKSK